MSLLVAGGRIAVAVFGLVFLGAILLGPRPSTAAVEQAPAARTFWSRLELEPDTVASAWLLERHACPGCEILLVPRGEEPGRGTAFDVPFAELARTRVRSSFHVIRERMQVEAPGLATLEGLIDEVEVRSWHRLPSEAATQLDAELRAVIESAPDPRSALHEGYALLDRWIARLQDQQARETRE